jgi:hypothetical protein
MPSARLALIRRHLRQRFGIAARHVGIHSEVRWYWHALLFIGVVWVSLTAAGWMYDAGRRFAGFDRAESDRELVALKEKVSDLESRAEQATESARVASAQLQVELATLEQVSSQVRSLRQENAALKEDLALFDGLVAGAAQAPAGIRVPRATLELAAGGKLKYRILILHQPAVKGAKDFSGTFQFHLTLRREGRNVIMSVPPDEAPNSPAFRFSVKHLYRAEGDFEVPAGSELVSAELRLLQDGAVKLRQAITL